MNRKIITILRNSLKKCLNQFLWINKTARQKDIEHFMKGGKSIPNRTKNIKYEDGIFNGKCVWPRLGEVGVGA